MSTTAQSYDPHPRLGSACYAPRNAMAVPLGQRDPLLSVSAAIGWLRSGTNPIPKARAATTAAASEDAPPGRPWRPGVTAA